MSRRDTRRCLLVLDDDPGFRAMVRTFLELRGFRVVEAGNGREARGLLARFPVDAALVDLDLDGEDGFALGRWLGRTCGGGRVLFLSGDPGRRPGAVGSFLEKPFPLETLAAWLGARFARGERA